MAILSLGPDRVFPVLAKCDALPQHILQILRHVDPSKHTQGLSKKLTNFNVH